MSIFAEYLRSQRIPSTGRVVGIGVEIYEDSNLTIPLLNIDWGFIEPNETKDFRCYVKSTSNVPIFLIFWIENWSPVNASEFLVLSWDYENSTFESGDVKEIWFSLFVAPDVHGIKDFEFDIIVKGERV